MPNTFHNADQHVHWECSLPRYFNDKQSSLCHPWGSQCCIKYLSVFPDVKRQICWGTPAQWHSIANCRNLDIQTTSSINIKGPIFDKYIKQYVICTMNLFEFISNLICDTYLITVTLPVLFTTGCTAHPPCSYLSPRGSCKQKQSQESWKGDPKLCTFQGSGGQSESGSTETSWVAFSHQT